MSIDLGKHTVIGAIGLLLIAAGCQTERMASGISGRQAWDSSDREVFTFTLQSDPAGADVFLRTVGDAGRHLGKTPLDMRLQLVRRNREGLAGAFGKGTWRAVRGRDSPFTLQMHGDLIRIGLSGLTLHKEGYAAEEFSQTWTLPASLQRRLSWRQREPVARAYREDVVFRNPTAAQAQVPVRIDCATGQAQIRAYDGNGNPGEVFATTPFDCVLGYSPVRNDAGDIHGWRVWAGDHAALWQLEPGSDLFFKGS